jgi:microcystin-dependent protein
MAPQALNPSGSSQPHDNMMPFQAINFILSLFGIFPTQV